MTAPHHQPGAGCEDERAQQVSGTATGQDCKPGRSCQHLQVQMAAELPASAATTFAAPVAAAAVEAW